LGDGTADEDEDDGGLSGGVEEDTGEVFSA
jgi:hypothetical protein